MIVSPLLLDNKLIIRPRDPDNANRMVDLTQLTTKDLICWFHRGSHTFYDAEPDYFYLDLNRDFDPNRPVGYQWTRVDVARQHKKEARLPMCIFCQTPTFKSLVGADSILLHHMLMHPHEVPPFVKMLLEELSLMPKYEPRYRLADRDPSEYVQPLQSFTRYLYRQDGFSNQLRFAPRDEYIDEERTMMKLSHVSELVVFPWYWRDIGDMHMYNHANAQYYEFPMFNPVYPEVSQIYRVGYCDQTKERYRMQMCMHCQEPKFFSMHGSTGLLAHMVVYHWGLEMPSTELVAEWDEYETQ